MDSFVDVLVFTLCIYCINACELLSMCECRDFSLTIPVKSVIGFCNLCNSPYFLTSLQNTNK